MHSFLTYLTELGDRPYPYRWVTQSLDYQVARFDTPNHREYRMSFDHLEQQSTGDDPTWPMTEVRVPVWNVVFTREWRSTDARRPGTTAFDSYGIVPTKGEGLAILVTVSAILTEWIQRTRPSVVLFSAKEPSRISLYAAATKRLASRVGMVGLGPLPSTAWQHWMSKNVEWDLNAHEQFFLWYRHDQAPKGFLAVASHP